MNIEQALKIMYEGGNVESLVSNTAYSFEKIDDKIKLRAEGIPVDFTYITKEEIEGEFREIYIVDSQEKLNSLSEQEREKLLSETFKNTRNKFQFDKDIRNRR